MAREAFVMNGRTAARVRQLAQSQTPANVNGVDTSSGRQVVWVTVTGEAVSGEGAGLDGWYPCRVEIGADGDAFVEHGYSLCKHHKGEPLAVGYRYAGLRQKPKDGESRFLVIGRTACTSAEDAYAANAHAEWRKDGFHFEVSFSSATPIYDLSEAAGAFLTPAGVELMQSSLTVPAEGWYDIDLRINAKTEPMTASGTLPTYWDFGLGVVLYRMRADGTLGKVLVPLLTNPSDSVVLTSSGSGMARGGAGSYSIRLTCWFPDDERGLRAMLTCGLSSFTHEGTTQMRSLTVIGSGSLVAEWAGPRIDPAEYPPLITDTDGQAIADGYSPNPEETYQWTLDGTASYPPTGETITDYDWSVLCPDTTVLTFSGATTTNEFDSYGEGEFVATLTVTFSDATTDTDTHNFTIPYVPPEPASMLVLVYGDTDADGSWDGTETEGGLPTRYVWVQGIDVEDGGLAPTDEDGYVTFSDLEPGTYSVSIYPTSLGSGEYVSSSPHPVTVPLTAGASPEIQIGIATTGSGGPSPPPVPPPPPPPPPPP